MTQCLDQFEHLFTVQQTLTAVIHREEDLYVAQCPEVDTASQGAT